MASESQIQALIEGRVSTYAVWTIGVTDSPTTRKAAHGNPIRWYQWNADTEQAARNVEAHFIGKGMQGGTGGPGKADYVYIFLDPVGSHQT